SSGVAVDGRPSPARRSSDLFLTAPGDGPLGGFVRLANGDPVWLWRNIGLFLPGVAVITIWWTTGFNVLIFLAGLRALPAELYEADRKSTRLNSSHVKISYAV